MQLTITPLAEAGVAVLPPDIVWKGYVGDFAVSMREQNGSIGGLVAVNPLRSAVVMLLFTDVRADVSDLRFEHRGDRRGWPGDGFDLEPACGRGYRSARLLWIYRRRELTDDTGRAMASEAERALQPLIQQKAVARIAVGPSRSTSPEARSCSRSRSTAATGGRDIAERFDYLWRQVDGGL